MIYELTDDTFESFLTEHPNTVVDFYSTNCSTCKIVEHIYSKVDKVLNQEQCDLVLAKVNVDVCMNTAISQRIFKLPEIRFYQQNKSQKVFTNLRALTDDLCELCISMKPDVTLGI